MRPQGCTAGNARVLGAVPLGTHAFWGLYRWERTTPGDRDRFVM